MYEMDSLFPCKKCGAIIGPFCESGISAAKRWFGEKDRFDVPKKLQQPKLTVSRAALRLGFVPLTDSAPLVMAHELGLFRKYGLQVKLTRELGWASIRDRVIHRELDAAHAVSGMPFAATLGLGSVRCECLTGLVLNQHGNGITLSNDLWSRGVQDATTLREEIFRQRGRKTFTFGVVFPFSSHNFLLRGWLAAAGINPDSDVRIVVVSPPQMVANLKAGHLDGFCAGEPWNSLAVQAGAGWIAAISAELAPRHPEKVLMVRREFAEQRSDEHLALIAGLLDACAFCDDPENRGEVIAILSRPEYVGVTADALRPAFSGEFNLGHRQFRTVTQFNSFHGDDANEPSREKAAWVIQHLRNSSLCKDASALDFELGRRVFRMDIFEKASRLHRSTKHNHEHETEPEKQIVLA